MKLLGNRVLIKQTEAETISKGGIHIPEAAKENSYYGVVTAVGPGKIKEDGTRYPMTVAVGDYVHFSKEVFYSEITIKGEKYFSTIEDFIIGIDDGRQISA